MSVRAGLSEIRKRAFDLALAVPALVATAPAIAALAIAVKLDSPGPALYAQSRVGRHRRPIRVYKLRSMVVGADRAGAHVTASGDARITRLGRLLQPLEHALIFERGRVATRLRARRHLAQQPPHDLARAGFGQRLGKPDLLGPRERTDLRGHVLAQLLGERLVGDEALTRRHERDDRLAF